jgi:hypothetical protein
MLHNIKTLAKQTHNGTIIKGVLSQIHTNIKPKQLKKKSDWKCLRTKRKTKFWLTSTLLNIADNERLPVCLSVCLSALSSWMRKFDFLMKTFLKCFVRFFALAKKVSQVSLTWKRVKIRKSLFFSFCFCLFVCLSVCQIRKSLFFVF